MDRSLPPAPGPVYRKPGAESDERRRARGRLSGRTPILFQGALPMTIRFPRAPRVALLLLALVAAPARGQMAATPTLTYHVQVMDRGSDRFQVRFHVEGLGPEHDVLQFASTAPGTYQVMDVGRYVENLRATDA